MLEGENEEEKEEKVEEVVVVDDEASFMRCIYVARETGLWPVYSTWGGGRERLRAVVRE